LVAQSLYAIKQNSDILATNLTDPNLSDTEVEEKTQKIIQYHIKNHKFVSLSDIVEEIEQEESSNIVEVAQQEIEITEKIEIPEHTTYIPESVNIVQKGSKFILQDTTI
jgi:hypothetical protein